ncbi:MAG TPA: TetR/AcrR family transcriptional regulator [Conexibacter sp.]|nr:TetR/AcrR family transcriptional regulator [Conexibacter sp.]
MTATSTRARRTQEERRAATRSALLDAALACLVEHGYEGTTTGRVCERAGVSRGAHQHHFGTRPALVAAALEELAMRRLDEIRREVASLPQGEARVEQALEAIWGWFTGPLFQASIDLAAAARTDRELRAQLAPVEARLSQGTLRCCREMLAPGSEDRSRDQLIQMTLGTVRGLALLPILQPGSRSAAKQWTFARDRLVDLFRV